MSAPEAPRWQGKIGGAESDAPVLCAACYLTLTKAGFNPCDQSSPSCPPPPAPTQERAL